MAPSSTDSAHSSAPECAALRCVQKEFEARAAEAPDRVAIVEERRSLSYGTLNERANALAHYLLASPACRHEIIGLLAHRSAETIIAVLAVLKAGRAFLALDPDYPAERLRLLAHDSGAPLLTLDR